MDADRLQPLLARFAGCEQDTQLLCFSDAGLASARAEHSGDSPDLVGRGAERAEFALSTRRLEITVAQLRTKIVSKLAELRQKERYDQSIQSRAAIVECSCSQDLVSDGSEPKARPPRPAYVVRRRAEAGRHSHQANRRSDQQPERGRWLEYPLAADRPGTRGDYRSAGLNRIHRASQCPAHPALHESDLKVRTNEAPGFEAKTIHRLLEIDPRTGGFRRDSQNPLDCDLLIVDEISMVDVAWPPVRWEQTATASRPSPRECARSRSRGSSCRRPAHR